MHRWDDTEQFLIDEAERDLGEGEPVRPCLVAFRGDEPLLVAFLRWHAKGAYADPMIELLTIAGGLGADRLMLSLSGRAWSLEDPVPPVIDGVGDLRQRVVIIHRVDGTGPALHAADVIRPYEVVGSAVCWGGPIGEEAAAGWIPQALRLTVERRDELAASDADIAAQVLRCDRLGHLVGLAPAVTQRLGLESVTVDS